MARRVSVDILISVTGEQQPGRMKGLSHELLRDAEILVRDRIAGLYASAGRDPRDVHVRESPAPGPSTLTRLAAWASTIVRGGRATMQRGADAIEGGRYPA